jgi:hypothetical protein
MFEVKYWNSFFVSSYMFLLVFLHILKKWMMSLMCLFCMQIFLKYTLYTYVCKFNFMRRRSVVPFVQPCWPLRWDCWKVHVLDDLNGVFCSSMICIWWLIVRMRFLTRSTVAGPPYNHSRRLHRWQQSGPPFLGLGRWMTLLLAIWVFFFLEFLLSFGLLDDTTHVSGVRRHQSSKFWGPHFQNWGTTILVIYC